MINVVDNSWYTDSSLDLGISNRLYFGRLHTYSYRSSSNSFIDKINQRKTTLRLDLNFYRLSPLAYQYFMLVGLLKLESYAGYKRIDIGIC